ncbi:MAG: hypothetical protein ACJAVV_003142 [Alphaproteobacteria bacterium]|jgi:hypothetical protein
MLKVLTPIIAALMLSGCIVHVGGGPGNANQHHEKILELDITNINVLNAETGAGSLKIIGEQGISKITVDANVYTIDESDFTLTLVRSGSKAKLVADASSRSGNSWHIGGNSPRIDLIVKMPADLALQLDDGSGSIDIKGLTNNIEIEDGSGSLKIDGGNNIQIIDGSGSLTIKNATGNVDIEDRAGSVTVNNTQGKVTIDDSAGGINVDGAGHLEIINSGSGGVSIDGVGGTVIVDE